MKIKLVAALVLLSLVAASLLSAQPSAFTYQGRLDDGGPPATGTYDLQFSVHAAATNGSPAADPVLHAAVNVSNGLFIVTLDFGAPVFSGAERWLEIAVRTNGGAEFTSLTPRQRLTATPYAITAGHVTGPISGAALVPGSITGNHLATGAVSALQLAPGAAAANLNARGQTLGGRSQPVARLISELKQQNLYADLVYLQVYGRDAQDADNSLTLRGPRQALRGGTNYTFGLSRVTTATNQVILLPHAVSNVTLFTAMAGAMIPENGLERNIIGIHSPGPWPWASAVRLYKSGGNALLAQTLGPGGQAFWNPVPNLGPYWLTPRTYALAVDVTANAVVLAVDGVVGLSATYVHGDPAAMTALDFGAGHPGPDWQLKGTYAMQAVWNRALATNEIAALNRLVRRTVLPENNIVFEGDSITDFSVDGRSFWQDLIGYGSDWSLAGNPVSIATAGHATSNVTNEWPAQVSPYAPAGNVERAIVVLWLGANDVGNYSAATRSNAQIFHNLRTLWAQAKALGFEVCAVTIFRRESNGSRPSCPQDVLAINDLIRADRGVNYDYLVDVETAMTAAAGENYWTNPGYFPDGVHPAAAAARAVILDAFKQAGPDIFP